MQRLKLTLSYDGTDFAGWQVQGPVADTDQRTVQGVLESALQRIAGQFVRVHAAGRTDAGVHALGQVVHCDIPAHRVEIPWRKAVNAALPPDVLITSAEYVPDDFHSRYDAASKRYAYTLWETGRHALPIRRRYVGATGPLDIAAMLDTAERLTGCHDFQCFQNLGTPVKSTVRTVTGISREPGMMDGEWVWRFEADGFLKQMVRNMMGLLVLVGRGKMKPDDVQAMLAGTPREHCRYATAPPQGLCLERIDYGPSTGRATD